MIPHIFVATPSIGTNGATPTPSDSVPDRITAVFTESGSTLTYTTTSPVVGSRCYALTTGGARRAMIRKNGFGIYDRQFNRAYFNKDTGTVNAAIIKGWQTDYTGSQALVVRSNTTRHLEVQDKNNNILCTTTAAWTLNATWRVLLEITSIAAGTGNLHLFTSSSGGGSSPDETQAFNGGAACFGSSIPEWTWGNCATNNNGNAKFGGISVATEDPGAYVAGESSIGLSPGFFALL